MNEIGKLIIIAGIVLIVLGIIMTYLGKLPGDIVFKKGNTTFYFPIVTSILVSIIFSAIMYLFGKFFR
ncbi:MAG: hypothetical protein K0S51_236 [Bacillales bacterium]|jgi:hypothetical protein|nr:hypothetical protein [Bacillales bacterium]